MKAEARRRISGSVAGLTLALGAVWALGPATGHSAPLPPVAPGDIIVADESDSQIEVVNPETGAKFPVASGGNLVAPFGIAFDADGNILVVDRDAFGGDGGVIEVDRLTGAQTVVSNNAISDAAGGQQRFADPVAIDRKGKNAYVTDYGGRPSRVIKVNLETGKQSLLSGGKNIGDPLGIDTGLKHALVADAGSRKSDLRLSGGLIGVDLRSGKQKVIAGKGDFPDLEDLGDVDSEDRRSAIVIDSGAFNYTGAMFRVNLDTGKAKTIFKSSGIIPAGLAVASNETAYVTRVFPASLYEVDLQTGELTLLNGSGFNNPLGLGIAP